jgi:hypothetical protein
MKEYQGLNELIAARNNLPKVGWIFVEKDFKKTVSDALLSARFFVQENDDDEIFGEEHLSTWLETRTFLSVLQNREKNINVPSALQYAEAAVHYLVEDDFLE